MTRLPFHTTDCEGNGIKSSWWVNFLSKFDVFTLCDIRECMKEFRAIVCEDGFYPHHTFYLEFTCESDCLMFLLRFG
jgi:hypothetical protein